MVHDCDLIFQDLIYVLDIRIWRDRKINGYESKNGQNDEHQFLIYYMIMRKLENT